MHENHAMEFNNLLHDVSSCFVYAVQD